jgi:hypothetical protein
MIVLLRRYARQNSRRDEQASGRMQFTRKENLKPPRFLHVVSAG